jgi:SAM-dependent methyltransferase
MTTDPSQFEIQDSQYFLPYHYLPAIHPFTLHRRMRWGLEYMTYISFVADLVANRSPDSLLDVGCGDGRLLFEVSPYARRTSGVDLSQRAVSFAKIFNPNSEIKCTDVADLTGQYDVVTMIDVLEHVPDESLPNFLAAVSARLSAGGLLVVTAPTSNQPLNQKHYRHYTLESLSAALEPYFAIEKHWWLYRHNLLEKTLRNLLCNGLWILSSGRGQESLWRIHKRFNYHADARTGTHLVLTARGTNDRPGESRR